MGPLPLPQPVWPPRRHRPRPAIEALKVHQIELVLAGHQTEGLVFTGRTGKVLYASRVRQHWAKVQAALGTGPIRFHDLRHSCATILLVRSVPIDDASRKGGDIVFEQAGARVRDGGLGFRAWAAHRTVFILYVRTVVVHPP